MGDYLFHIVSLPNLHESVNWEPPLSLITQILKNASDGILFIRLDGTLLLSNPSIHKILKIKPNPTQKQYWDLFEDEFFGFSMRESLKFGISHRLLYKNWMGKELEISTSFFFEGTKSQQGLLVFCRDITEIKQLQINLNRNERFKTLGALTANVVHEIRNPLGGIRGFAMLLYKDLEKQPYLQEMASSIIEASKSMEKLVNSILHYTRPIHLEIRSVDLSQHLRQWIRFIKADPAFVPSVHLITHIPQDPVWVPIDPELLKAALLNLVSNGLQAMEQGGVLTFSLIQRETQCEITLSDTGVGMNEEQLQSLFTPFFTTKQKGNGLGLVETQKIIQAHGGTVEVRSILGKGSSFVIHLPCKRSLP